MTLAQRIVDKTKNVEEVVEVILDLETRGTDALAYMNKMLAEAVKKVAVIRYPEILEEYPEVLI